MLDNTIASILKKIPTKVVVCSLFICSLFISFVYNNVNAKLGLPRMPETWVLISTIVFGITLTFVVYYLINFIYTKHKKKKLHRQSEPTLEDIKNEVFQFTDNLNPQELKILNDLIDGDKEYVISEHDLFNNVYDRQIIGKKHDGEEIINSYLVKDKFSYWIINDNFKNTLKLLKSEYGQISRFDKGEK